jgi:branched-chain amino acid transport system ATP-binding protein
VLLEINGLTKYFGGLAAVSQFGMSINHGEIVGLIGPNGAGKTTIINLISGFLRPSAGSIIFDGENITYKKPHLVANLGIGRTFQIVPLFSEFTVLQNVVASFYLSADSSLWGSIFRTSRYCEREKYILTQAEENLQLVGLGGVRDELAKNLPHGYQKMLGLARALSVKPKLLLLDEPMAGMNPDEINLALKAIDLVRSQGITILLIEHNMVVMNICERIIVINYGRKIAEGSLEELRKNEDVIRAYLGEEYVT